MLNATTTAGAQLRNLVIIVICIALLGRNQRGFQ